MDETIDLRPYVEAIRHYWWVIVGSIVLAALGVLGIRQLATPEYEATSLIAITNPTQEINLDPRIRDTLELNDLARSFPEMAMSDSVLNEVLQITNTGTPGTVLTLEEFRGHLGATMSEDARLLRLTVRSDNPEFAAKTTNYWAEAFLTLIGAIYVGTTEETRFYQGQLVDASEQVEAAEQALVKFQAINLQAIIDNELDSLSALQIAYLSDQRNLGLVADDVDALLSQLENESGDTTTLADQITSFNLQLKAYDALLPAAQFQLTSDGILTSDSKARQIQLLASLSNTIDSQIGATDSRLADIGPQLLELQRSKQELIAEETTLTRNRDVAQETYVTLARKVDELRITSDNSSSGIHLASEAAVPTAPTQRSLPLMLLLATTIGMLFALAAIILTTWWRTNVSPANLPASE